ncbi:MAG: hypothetical protein MJZ52_07075 [Bacteroidales bacterium]|nr:hypothetical protein [Bacteroidales bacterium]
MRLNIYNKKEVVKTYEAETYDLMFGTVEDILRLVKIDEMKTGSDVEIIKMVGSMLIGGLDDVKFLLFDIFDGLTDDELRNTKTTEVAKVIVDVVKYAIVDMNKNVNSKN